MQATVAAVQQSPHKERMSRFVESFPSLRGAPGVRPWNQLDFAEWATKGKSHGERLAAAFVLSVWNGHAPKDGGWWNQKPFKVGRFDVVEAFQVWDAPHKAAFLAWCDDVFLP